MEEIYLKFFNTETRKKETFKPLVNKQVLMYTCGPTVYDFAHIGNFRTYVFEDLLRRTLKYFGFDVKQAMNITDVDDKTIKGATAKGLSLDEYTKPFMDAFFEDLNSLGIEKVEYYPQATDYIPQMIEVIEGLIQKGMAYKGKDNSIYYPIHKFKRYGCLSHLNLEDLQAGASDRVSTDEYDKENVSDFVLWKSYEPKRDGKIFWESPFGPGRPGWHLECSVMAMRLLGETIDIHVGGVDNMFPHHENEIAQSEAYTEKQFVKLWMHSEHLLVDNKKMSKSLGNFYTFRDLLKKGFGDKQIRYALLTTHYKTQLNFTFEGLNASRNALQRLDDFIQRMIDIQSNGLNDNGKEIQTLICETQTLFSHALADDLNISSALAVLFDFVREVNSRSDANQVTQQQASEVLSLLRTFDTVLNVLNFELKGEEIPLPIQEAFQLRLNARQEKNWVLADQLRDHIHNEGYLIEDTPKGARLKKVK